MASLELKIIVDAETGIAKIQSFGDAVEGSAKKQKSAWDEVGGALKSLAAIYIADKGLEFLKSSVEEYANAEKAAVKLDAVLRATHDAAGISAQGMKNFASQLQATTAFEDDAIVNAEAMLATFTKINDPDIFKQTVAASLDLATVMDGDLKGATLQLGKALNDPAEGLAALKKSGVSFTASQVDLIKKLQDSGDLLGAQKIILAEVNKEMGGAAEAGGRSFAGQMARLANETGNAKEAIGGFIAQGISPLIPKLTEAAQGVALFFDNLGKGQEKSKTDLIGKDFAFITKQIFEANKEVARLKYLYGASAESVGAYHTAVKKVEMLEKQRAKDVAQYGDIAKQNADAEAKAAKEREAMLKADKEAELWAANAKAREKYADTAKKTMAEIGTDEEKLVKKYEIEADQIKGVSKEAAAARYAIQLKLSAALAAVWKKDDDERSKQHDELNKMLTASDETWLNDREKSAYKYLAAADTVNGMEMVGAEEKNAALLQLEVDHKARIANIDQKEMEERSRLQSQFQRNTSAQLVAMLQSERTAEAERIAIRDELYNRDNDYFTSFNDNLVQASGANKTFYDQMGELGAATGTALKGTFKSVFEDGLNGDLQNSAVYIEGFKKAMVAAIAAVAAEWVIKHTVMSEASLAFFAVQEAGWAAVAVKIAAALAVIVAIVAAVKAVSDNWEGIKVTFKDTCDFMIKVLTPVYDLIKAVGGFIDGIRNILTGVWNSDALTAIKNTFQGIADAINTIVDALNKLNPFKDNIANTSVTLGGGGGLGVSGEVFGSSFSFANGGIMTSSGVLPLHTYAGGGIAAHPQLALFGEGRLPEAYIPLPDRRSVPVTLTTDPSPQFPPVQILVQVGAREIFNDFIDLLKARQLVIPAHSVM